MANLPVEFSIDVTGETTGDRYQGVFKAIPRLSHSRTLNKDQIRRDLLGGKGEEASQEAINIANVFSTIYAHLTSAPSFWTDANRGLDLLDESVVAEVYSQIIKLEADASMAVKKAGEAAAKALKDAEAK